MKPIQKFVTAAILCGVMLFQAISLKAENVREELAGSRFKLVHESYVNNNWELFVTSADGTTAVWHKRDRKEFFDQTSRSAVLHAKLYKNWASLKEQYTEALPHLTSSETWSESFGR